MTPLLDVIIWPHIATGFVGLAPFRARSPWLPGVATFELRLASFSPHW